MSGLSTHILDLENGLPASSVQVKHFIGDQLISSATTNSDGRIPDLLNGQNLTSGSHRLNFLVGEYFAKKNSTTFFKEINIDFEVHDVTRHHHVPLLLSSYGYSTYRGS